MWIPVWTTLTPTVNNMKFNTGAGTPVVDVCPSPFTSCDYNSYYGRTCGQVPCSAGCTNQGVGYAGSWSVGAGTTGGVGFHDQDSAAPGFVTSWNNVPTDCAATVLDWDQWFLGVPLSSNLFDGVTDYLYGDIVQGYYTANSNGTPNGYLNNRKYNFVCIRVTGCPHTGPRPGTPVTAYDPDNMGVSQWQRSWMWGGVYYMSQWIGQNLSITDGSPRPTSGNYPAVGCTACSPVQALINSIHAAYTPTNLALKNAAHDGVTDIGPVPVKAVSACPSAYPASILSGCNSLAAVPLANPMTVSWSRMFPAMY